MLVMMGLALSFAAPSIRAESPCNRVDRTLSKNRRKTLAPAIAQQLNAKHVDLLKSYRSGGWSILYVATGEADETYVFYSDDPLRSRYVTLWSGAAGVHEEEDILTWTLKNASSIPNTLATCFAWQVTIGQASR